MKISASPNYDNPFLCELFDVNGIHLCSYATKEHEVTWYSNSRQAGPFEVSRRSCVRIRVHVNAKKKMVEICHEKEEREGKK